MKNLKKNARNIVAKFTSHGISKSDAKKIEKIFSLGTERNYRQCIFNFLLWCLHNSISPDFRSNISVLKKYLEERREWAQQKALNMERQALQLIYKQKLPYIISLKNNILENRSYTYSQVSLIVSHQNFKNAITTWLCFFCGLRAHEAATILPKYERNASPHRSWDTRRFMGLNNFNLYTVTGKGGLTREVQVPHWLCTLLESQRRPPTVIVDREIRYISHYEIGYGQAWSESFSSASKRYFGFTKGGHGLRHSFARWRLITLIQKLESNSTNENQHSHLEEAMLILSQELGNFRLDIVFCYLR